MEGSPLEAQIGPLLRQRGLKLAVAESCTGGLVGHRITNIPGASEYYLGSITAYAYQAKRVLLHVNPESLLKFGAVSREVSLQMAYGVRRAFTSSDIPIGQVVGLSVTGIAGPGGGSQEKPVGRTWIGLSTSEGDWAWKFDWESDRIGNKLLSAGQVLRLTMDYLTDNLPPE